MWKFWPIEKGLKTVFLDQQCFWIKNTCFFAHTKKITKSYLGKKVGNKRSKLISGKNGCPCPPWPQKFSRPLRPENAPSLTVTPARTEAKKRLPRASLLCWAYNASRPGEKAPLLRNVYSPPAAGRKFAGKFMQWRFSAGGGAFQCVRAWNIMEILVVWNFSESNVINILNFPCPQWNYSNFWIQCKRNCRGPHWSHPVWILFPWINSDQLNVSTAKNNPRIRNIKTWEQYFGLRWSNTLEISNLNLTYFEIWCCKWYV